MSSAHTFIRAVEVWLPGSDRQLLEFGGGLYAGAPRFGAQSRQMVFGRGEGLPGAAWEAGHPIVLRDLAQPVFRRAALARAEGLTCGIAVPVFAGDFLTSLLVLFCGDDAAHAGAIELWRNVPSEGREMTLVDGYYGSTGDAFELISRSVAFRRGVGLPGQAWDSGLPVFVADLGRGDRFLRADSAVKVGINRGIAIPCSTPGDEHCVITFLSALATPIARRFEIWTPDASRQRLLRVDGHCEHVGSLAASPEVAAAAGGVERGQGTIGRAFVTGCPAVSDAAAAEPGLVGEAAAAAGWASLVALPVIREGRLAAVVAWYL
jgi:hypothetical protein